MTGEQNKPTTTDTVQEGKTMGIISYITLIGTIVAYFMNNDKKNSFAAFHIRQNIGLNLLYIINSFLIYRLSSTAAGLVGLFLFVLWIIGLIGAAKGEEKKVPLLGDQFQEWFKGI